MRQEAWAGAHRALNFRPVEVVVVGHGREDSGVQSVELVQKRKLILCLLQLWVLRDRQAEQLLARVIREKSIESLVGTRTRCTTRRSFSRTIRSLSKKTGLDGKP